MPEPSSNPPVTDRSTMLAERRTELAFERTRIAADRTLMAWIRTSLSLISFGFTIYKFLQAFREAQHFTGGRPNAPRNLGMALIGVGTVVLIVATIQHYQDLSRLKAEGQPSLWSLTIMAAVFVSIIGILAFVGAWLHTGPF